MSGRGARSVAEATDTPRPASATASTSAAGQASTGAPQRRAYDASGRRAAAERRRAHVVETATRLFAEQGWVATTIAGIAREAGVSAEYVTKAFGGKAELLMAGMQASLQGRGTLPQAFASMELGEEPDVDVRLDRIVDFACEAVERMAPIVPVVTHGAVQDERLRELLDRAHEGHLEVSQEIVRLIGTAGAGPDAVDEVYVLTRAETYLTLVQHRRWTRERYAGWLRRALVTAAAPAGEAPVGRPHPAPIG